MGLLVMILGLALFFAAHVFTTKRKPDGTPLHPNVDESEMIYGVQKTG